MSQSKSYEELLRLGQNASQQFVSLLSSWSWAEVNDSDNDRIRRLLIWAPSWVCRIANKNEMLRACDAANLLDAIEAIRWDEKSLAAKDAIRQCAVLALALSAHVPAPKLSEFNLWNMSDAARIMLTVRAAKRAFSLLPKRAMTDAHVEALRTGIDFAEATVGQINLRLDGTAASLLQRIGALNWPGRSAVIAQAVCVCIRAASDPALDEQSQLGLSQRVAGIDLSFALKAGVKVSDLGRDYMELSAR